MILWRMDRFLIESRHEVIDIIFHVGRHGRTFIRRFGELQLLLEFCIGETLELFLRGSNETYAHVVCVFLIVHEDAVDKILTPGL
jgi:hypothetical protein